MRSTYILKGNLHYIKSTYLNVTLIQITLRETYRIMFDLIIKLNITLSMIWLLFNYQLHLRPLFFFKHTGLLSVPHRYKFLLSTLRSS